ncbi:hypothetical protein B0J14DRAFT_487846 [Halenospora varia]|nr:hypothetical protein B0J14DRAFT_487846 [Halenospora varia]
MEQTQEPPQTAQEESLGVASQSAQGSSSNLIPQLEEFHLPGDHETGFQNDIIHQSPSIVPNEEKEDKYHSVEHHHGGNGSNSPLSADSADSDQTDPAHYFTQTHPDYEEPGIDTSHHEDKVQEPALPEHTYTSPQPESSSAQSSSGTSIPDDGYYPTSLHVDSEMSDSDSALGSEMGDSTMSMNSSLFDAIQPEYVPPNCQFEIDDAEDEWMFSQKFDFIHGRMLFTCFQNPAQVFIQAYKSLSPGGYFEIQDALFTMESIDGTGDGTAVQQWNAKICDGARKIGRDWHCTRNYAQFMRDAGFENVMERKFKWPTNTWPKGKKAKTLGMWSLANNLDGLSAVSMAILSRAQGMSREEVEVGMVDVRRDLRDKNIHGYIPV